MCGCELIMSKSDLRGFGGQGPMITVGQPAMMTPPCAVGSPILAAIKPPIRTVGEPMRIVSGGPTHVARSVTRAAGSPPISTVGHPGGRIGPPTCGTTPVTIGQVCMSVTRAAGGMDCQILISRIYFNYRAGDRNRRWSHLDSAGSAAQLHRSHAIYLYLHGLRLVRARRCLNGDVPELHRQFVIAR